MLALLSNLCFYCAVIIDSLFQRMHPGISKSEDDEETIWRKYDSFSF